MTIHMPSYGKVYAADEDKSKLIRAQMKCVRDYLKILVYAHYSEAKKNTLSIILII